ncbi:uncharacterized protein N7483_010780 [Penicillium malachiteum]|uniref:uncharacterized protein n=1 Tax=Penicillium malachiteum TaxID=1324776 RepID=UPI002547D358|nr:uncharacterized protein N7483_010780 [Penicillium malachiteum]KAJ5713599.1 hypothetical protein N7483_010780 [Penicillium malachiteum]
MLLGYLKHVTNRCVQLALPDYLSNTGSRLEVFSYGFPALQNAPIQRESNFKERWNSSLQLDEMDNMLCAFGDWIEDDYRSYKKSSGTLPLMKEGFKVENHYFVGLLFWKSDIDMEMPSKLANQFAILAKRQTLRLPLRPNKCAMKDQILHCKKNCQDSIRLACEDKVHIESMKASWEPHNTRLVPSPAGNWNRMGSMTQYGLPQMFEQRTRESNTVLEVIAFRILQQSAHFEKLFADFRIAIWKLRDRPGVFRASDHNNPTRVFLLAGAYS